MKKLKTGKPRPQCRFCQVREASVEAHIIPRSFFRSQADEGQPAFVLSNKRTFASKTWTGLYDNALVCAACEARFNEIDRYGHQFFFREQLLPLYDETGELIAWQHPTAEAGKLKLFILSILWRASASRREEFRAIDLGRWEPEIKRMIDENDPGTPDRFPVMLQKFDVPERETVIMYPYQAGIGGTLCYKTELGGCAAVVALQGREWPQLLLEASVAPSRPVTLFAIDYQTSQERERVRRIVAQHYRRHGRLPGKR